MHKMRLICFTALLALLVFTGVSCTRSTTGDMEESRKTAEEFVKAQATFQFDGIPETLKISSPTAMGDGWLFIVEFESRQAGYGDRTGQMLAQVITPHRSEVTVEAGKVTRAVMDGQWDMINQRLDIEIKPAPIDEVNITILKSNPPQISVYIKGGLPDGCTSFHDLETTREGNTVNIKVTVQRPRGVSCPAIYNTFEKEVNLGSDFIFGTTYTLKVNDYVTTFEGTLMKYEGFAVYLTKDDVPPAQMEMLSHVELTRDPVFSAKDIISYDARTHEIRLTDEAFERITQLEVPVRGKSFMVCVDRSPVYWGAFWTPVSSMSFDGVTIWKPFDTGDNEKIQITLGYPGSSFYTREDPRNDPGILESLEKAGKLINSPSTESQGKLPQSFKGYELYSWNSDGDWRFTLITGTNRNKTVEEIKSSEETVNETGWVKIQATGLEEMKSVLNRLPQNESVVWCNGLCVGETAEMNFHLPPAEIVDALRKQAEEHSLDFRIM